MQYISNPFTAKPQDAYNCAYGALMSYERARSQLSIPLDRVVNTPALLTTQANVVVRWPYKVFVTAMVTVEPLESGQCRLRVDTDVLNYYGSQSLPIRFVADYLDRFMTMLAQQTPAQS